MESKIDKVRLVKRQVDDEVMLYIDIVGAINSIMQGLATSFLASSQQAINDAIKMLINLPPASPPTEPAKPKPKPSPDK